VQRGRGSRIASQGYFGGAAGALLDPPVTVFVFTSSGIASGKFVPAVVEDVPDPGAGVVGVAGDEDGPGAVGSGARGAGCESASRNADVLLWAIRLLMIESTKDSAKNIPADHFVIRVSTLPDPAPNSASVAPEPNAKPTPASFFGSCISTSSASSRQFPIKMIVSNATIIVINANRSD
jgi:hypothetical protein